MIYDKVFNDTTDTLSFSVPGPAGTLRYQIDQTASYATAADMDAAAGSAAIVGDEVGAVGQNTEVIDTSSLAVGTWYIHLVWNNGQDTVPASTAFTIAAADNVGLAQGSALVLGVGASIAAAAGASDGVAVVTAVGSTGGAVQEGAGAASGVATVSGIGAATVASSGASAASAAVSGVGAATAAATASSASVATVSGVGSTAGGFDPASLFGVSDNGFFFDFSDLTTLWQDTTATTAITADGQAIARVNDKSGKGNNATQGTAANCPLYKTDGTLHWALPDTVNDALDVSISFTGPEVYIAYAFMPQSAGDSNAALLALGLSGTNYAIGNVAYAGLRRSGTTTTYETIRNNVVAQVTVANDTLAVLESWVASGSVNLALDGGTPATTSASTANLGASLARIFANTQGVTNNNADARLYAILVINRIPDATERANLLTWMAAKQGRTL